MQIFEEVLFFKLRTTEKQTINSIYLVSVRCSEAESEEGGRERERERGEWRERGRERERRRGRLREREGCLLYTSDAADE